VSGKGGLNKNTIKEGLAVFFSGDQEKVETALKAILENIPTKESSTLSLTGIKG
jgi:hypothetical protein